MIFIWSVTPDNILYTPDPWPVKKSLKHTSTDPEFRKIVW